LRSTLNRIAAVQFEAVVERIWPHKRHAGKLTERPLDYLCNRSTATALSPCGRSILKVSYAKGTGLPCVKAGPRHSAVS
jgi:hypothetical protein